MDELEQLTILLPPIPHMGATPENSDTPRLASAACSFDNRIMRAGLEHERFILHLQAKFSNQLGFLPRAAIEQYLRWGSIGLATENGEPAGYVLGRDAFRWCPQMRPITQAAVCFDAQRRHHGLALVQRVIQKADDAKQLAVQAMCANDIDANEFWRIAGFELIGQTNPKNARGRLMNCWRFLINKRGPAWIMQLPPVSGWKAKRTTAESAQVFIAKKQKATEAPHR